MTDDLGHFKSTARAVLHIFVDLEQLSMSHPYLASIALVVAEYDEAIEFYTNALGFDLIEDTKLSEEKRWVLIAPKGSTGCQILLAKAADEEQRSRIGNQTGGRVFLFIKTDSFDEDHARLLANGVELVREPVLETWGKVAVFKDLYGNLFDLIDPGYGMSKVV